VAKVKASGEVADLQQNSLTFVMVPAAGAQTQLRAAQRNYLREQLWSPLLAASNAGPVSFIEAVGQQSAVDVPAPPVPLPNLPGTPVRPMHHPSEPRTTVCNLATSTYFVVNQATLVDRAQTKSDLKRCVRRITENTKVTLDAWTSYDGPLAADGTPIRNNGVQLSKKRCAVIADLLIRMGVPAKQIVRQAGHGNADQPNPKHPSSATNRVVKISITTAK
jgi:outer membrane protein OmpA-like peptidoglycan-associated protein